tara:strand:- start:4605 stop:5750 length:1146 start_codon:yes stop_codon:yes gene_type:complete
MENKYWNLYGNQYDLEEFIDKHPGGSFILNSTRGINDTTALFESYHAFSDIEKHKITLNKYLIKKDNYENKYDFEKYNELVDLVKIKFPNNYSIKANMYYFFIIFAMLFTYINIAYSLLFNNISPYYKTCLVILFGINHKALMFNILHDSSHYAIFKNPSYNVFLSKISNSLHLWNNKLWNKHHIIHHHSDTGTKDDPDSYLYKLKNNKSFLLTNFMYMFLPGQHLAQSIFYVLGLYVKNPNSYDIYDLIIISFKIYFLYRLKFLYACIYLFTLNVLYFINIFPNHSLYETKVLNKYEGNDWLKLQIHNSGNFFNNNRLWTILFGGINYQIEHHLFPNVSNIHLPEISKIVRKYCNDNNIPYVNINSVYGIFESLYNYIQN